MEDYRLQQTGAEVQEILNTSTPQADLTAETERAQLAEQGLAGDIHDEELRAKAAEEANAGAIHDEELRAKAAEEQNAGAIASINEKIPSAASSENKLADVDFVNSSIATATATYRGSFNLVSDLHLGIDATHEQIAFNLGNAISEADNNDYCYVQIPTSAETPTQIASVERYKFTTGGWTYEYTINNSGFTAAQWAAINSGITSGLVAKLGDLPTATELSTLLAGKQDTLTFDNVPTQGSNNPVKSGGVYSAIDEEKGARVNNVNTLQGEIDGIEGKIPTGASSDNKLVDTATMNSSISTATATYRGDFNLVSDLHLAVDATHAQIATMLASEIATADNNDYCYVQIPTSAETPTQIAKVERYKYNGTAWGYEYDLNNSGFTASQWAALNSAITSGLVVKLSALPTNQELTSALAAKQDVLTFDSTPTENSTNPVTSGGVYAADKALSDAIEAILLLIPSAATQLNKLVDVAQMNSSISTATATYRGCFNLVSDLNLDLDATHAQIGQMLATVIPTADNSDYAFVQIPTAVGTPTEIAHTDRYKFNGTAWAYEYTLNTSGFTSAQWAAINSGITTALVSELSDIADLIPSEATQYNQLADKLYVVAQIIAHIADFKGEFATLLELQSVSSPKAGDLGIVRTKDNDGMDVFTFYQYLNSQWNVYYTLSYHPQIKPATTGTTGDYPYNGMGRVELPMNMVSNVNTLTQDMFNKGAVGFREPNTNTVFVIKYDFVLGSDITIPENCILEFDGGSISAGSGENKDTITGTNTIISGNPNFNCSFGGTFKNDWFETSWFPTKTIHQIANICRNFKYLYINTPYTLSSVLDLTDVFNVRMDKDYIITTSDNYIKMGSTDGIGKLCQCSISAAGHITIIGGYNLDFNIGYCESLKLQPENKNIGYSHFYLGTIIDFAIEANNYWVNSNIFNCARITSTITLRGNGNKFVSANIFNDCVLEDITMNFVKAASNRFYNTRMEGASSAPNTITFDENCYDNIVEGLQKNGGVWPITGQQLQHTNVTNNGYDSNVVRYAPDNYDRTIHKLTSNILDSYPLVGISKGNDGSFVSSGERDIAYIDFEELDNKDFGFTLGCNPEGNVVYWVYLYDRNGNKLTANEVPITVSLQSNIRWDGDRLVGSSSYSHAFCLMLSKNTTGAYIASAKVIVRISYNNTIQYLDVITCTDKESSARAVFEMASPKYGDTRPVVTDANIGFSMFDTTIHSGNGGPIWYKGNNVWVDATGNPV